MKNSSSENKEMDSGPLTPERRFASDAPSSPERNDKYRETDSALSDKPTQKVIAEVFGEILGTEKIGIHDNFFTLGGHSLMATKAAYRISNRLNVDVSLPALFENPTVAGLSSLIEEGLSRDDAKTCAESIPRSTRVGPLPASYAQKRMWFLDQLEHDSPLYNVSFMLHLKGTLHIQALEETVNDIIRRHDSLRTTLDIHGDEPVQVVHPHTYRQISEETIAGLVPNSSDNLAEHPTIKKEARTLFDIKTGPLIRFRIFRLSEDVHILLFTAHHIIFDGWSVDILLSELSEGYAARLNDRESNMPVMPIQYADFADWQQNWLEGKTRSKQLSYWLDKLKGPLPILELPLDYWRPDVMTYQGRRISLPLSSKLTADLKQLSNREGKTLFMTLLTAFNVLLHRYTRQEDLIVGSPIANRTRKEIEPVIGLFVNTLALRADLSGNPTFRRLLGQIQRVCLDAYANQDLPFEELVSHLQPERGAGRTPVFQIMFVLQNAHSRKIELLGVEATCEEISTDTSKFDLTLFMEEEGNRLVATAEYNTDLFRADTIQELLSYYQHLLEIILCNPDCRISDLTLPRQSKDEAVSERAAQSACDYPGTACVHELFDEQASAAPDAVAVVFEEQRLTYRQLNEQANRLAHCLLKKGVGPETPVGVHMDRCADFIVAILAVLKAGGAYVPLDTSYPRDRIMQMIETSKCRAILTKSHIDSNLDVNSAQTIFLDTDSHTIDGESSDSPQSASEPDHLAYIMFTSGSTGRPKAVAIPHRGIVRLLFDVDYVDFGGHQTFLQLSPVGFDASTFEIWGALLHGHRCVLYPGGIPDLNLLAKILEKYRVTCLWLTSSLFNFLIDEKPEMLKGVPQLLTGGEALSVEHVRRALRLLPDTQLINGYGPTESTTFACCYRIPKDLDERLRSIPIGRAIGHTQVHILDESLKPVPVGISGELYIGGNGLALGYFDSPELTAERFVRNPFDQSGQTTLYKTGDLCRRLPDGNIEFLGRLDNQVKIRGFRIEPGEIEATLQRHASVRQATVLARLEPPGEKRLVAYIVSDPSASAASEDLQHFLKNILPDYMIPTAFVYLDSMPLTPNGKVDREALPAPKTSLTPGASSHAPPETADEEVLAAIFAEVLKVKKVGIYDDFFKLGGSSLLAVKLLDRIQSQFNTSLPLSSLFQATTVRQLCELLATGRAETTHSSMVLIRPGGPAEPIFVLPGVGGHSMAFQMLARQLPPDRPVYGLELRGLDGEAKPHESIEDMASYFIELISSIQEQGPYYLAGYSLGGRIAFEMALQLAQRGRQVGMLALIGSTAPAHSRTSKYRIARYALRSMDFLALPLREKLNYLSFKLGTDLPRRIRRWRQERAIRSMETKTECTLRTAIEKVEAAAYKAWYDYKPKALYSGKALLIRETNVESPLYRGKIHTLAGWERYITGLIECHKIESGHINILDEPYVSRIAEKIKSHIAGAEQAEPGPAATRSALDGENQSGRRPAVSWPSIPDVLQIPKDQLHIYLTDLDALRSPTKYRSLLSSEELNRADGYVHDEDRDRFIVRRGILRELLGRYVNLSPADINLDYSEHGKPLLCDAQNPSGLTFSLATCGGMALYAFACDHPVGIDLECILPEENLLEMAKQQFSCREYEDLSNLPQTLQPQAFYTCWTCKEAYIKARGVIPLKQFDIAFDPRETPQLTADRVDPSQNKQWYFSTLDLGDHWSAAAVIGCKSIPLRCWQIEQLQG